MNIFTKLFNKKKQPIIVLIHGFGVRTVSEMDFLKDYYSSLGLEVLAPSLFDIRNPEDTDWMVWLSRAKAAMEEASQSNKDIYLVGYSMGGVIATHLATLYTVKKLVLLAPAFEYITIKNATNAITSFLSNEKKDATTVEMPGNFYPVFMNLVEGLKASAKALNTPVLIIHGTADQTIPYTSSRRIYKQIPAFRKQLILIEDASHRLMDEEISRKPLLALVEAFYNGKLLD